MSDRPGTLGGLDRFSTPRRNRLLAALPASDFEALRPLLAPVPMRFGDVLFESERRIRWFHFPISGVVSVLYLTPDGHSAEVAVVGNDGLVGVAALLGGGGNVPRRAVVHVPGHAYRIMPEVMLHEFQQRSALRDLVLRYIQARIAQVSQLAVCNRHHSLEQRLCRWLLQVVDRVGPAAIPITQELVGEVLGVRRSGVTQASTTLEADGMIERRRGRITVRDRAKLEARACECYAVVKNAHDALLPAKAFDAVAPSRHPADVD